jgi:hypothetical protein
VAVGIEVANTTADMYKQGDVTISQSQVAMAGTGSCNYIDTNAAPLDPCSKTAIRYGMWPVSKAQVKSVPGSITWPAAKGVYAVPRISDLSKCVFTPYLVGGATNFGFIPGMGFCVYNQVTALDLGTTPKVVALPTNAFQPLSIFFTGLSNQSSLTVTLRTIVEYSPEPNSVNIPMLKVSPALDIAALEAYFRIARDAPYAVPVSMNSAGEYFKLVWDVARGVAPTFAKFLAMPNLDTAAALGAGAYTSTAKAVTAFKQRRAVAKKPTGGKVPLKISRVGAGAPAFPTV